MSYSSNRIPHASYLMGSGPRPSIARRMIFRAGRILGPPAGLLADLGPDRFRKIPSTPSSYSTILTSTYTGLFWYLWFLVLNRNRGIGSICPRWQPQICLSKNRKKEFEFVMSLSRGRWIILLQCSVLTLLLQKTRFFYRFL